MTTAQQVKLELTELQRLGVPVSAKALAYVDSHATEMDDYRADGMRVSEIADLVRDLASMGAA